MLHRGLLNHSRRFFSRKIEFIRGEPNKNTDMGDLSLRGIKLNSNYSDNPNMIFFVDYFDKPENWLTFFMNNNTLDYRNVYILNNPNFGNSDYSHKHDLEAFNPENIANMVERFMWQNKISTATLAGHGFGARTAMLTGCYSPHLITGICAIDYTPTDYSFFDVVWRLETAVKAISQITNDMRQGNMSRAQINSFISENVEHPKMQALFKQNIKHIGGSQFDWDFNIDFLENHFKTLTDWKIEYGLYTGRVNFHFPEYSDYVFLNSHSIAMKKVAISCRNYMRDIISEFCENDEPYLNHFVYEDPVMAETYAVKLNRFLHMYDGVDLLLTNRNDIYERTFVPGRVHDQKEEMMTDHFPNHFHHNWRYQDSGTQK